MGSLNVERLSKEFRIPSKSDTPEFLKVFEDLTFTVPDQEFVSVIGPSGCGKSTLLNLIAGLDPATSGDIIVADKVVKGPGMDRGVVFQAFGLFPWLTVEDNIAFGLKSMGIASQERKKIAREYVDMVGLSEFSTYYPSQLSGGMRQRVGIGRALAIDPSVLLMDEPFGALDAQTREDMQAALTKIWQNTPKTVVFITHDIREAVYLSDRVIVLNGRPSRITLDLRIDMERPRVRRNPEFHAYEDRLDAAIRDPELVQDQSGEVK